jgi:hypothetical protein
MNYPRSLPERDQPHDISLDFDPPVTDEWKKVVADRKRAAIVGRYEFQAHVIATDVRSPIGRE